MTNLYKTAAVIAEHEGRPTDGPLPIEIPLPDRLDAVDAFSLVGHVTPNGGSVTYEMKASSKVRAVVEALNIVAGMADGTVRVTVDDEGVHYTWQSEPQA